MTDASRERRARELIRRIGVAHALILFVYFVASPFLAAVAPFYPSGWQATIEGAGRIVSAFSPPEPLLSWIYGESPLNSPAAFAAAYILLAGSATLCWMASIVVLHRYRDAVTAALAASVFRWSIAFCAVLVFATPVVVHDFWLSVGWGRLVAKGYNPYYVPIAPGDLPFRETVELMTYGPLWAILSGAAAFAAGGTLLGTAAIQKLFIAAAWVGCVWSVRKLSEGRGQAQAAMSVAVTGWAPIGLLHGIADGHTDMLMAFPMLLWLLLLEREKPFSASFALAASIAMKYVSAPLAGLHLVRGALRPRGDRRKWLGSVALCAAIVILLVSVFYRSPDFFSAASAMKQWRFFTPTAIADGVTQRAGIGGWFAPALDALLLLGVATIVVDLLRRQSVSAFRAAVLWTMFGVLIATVGHIWPWYLIWVLPLAAVQLDRRIAWAVVGMAAAAPFVLLPWTVLPELNPVVRLGVPGVALYVAALGGLIAGRMARRAAAAAGAGRLLPVDGENAVTGRVDDERRAAGDVEFPKL